MNYISSPVYTKETECQDCCKCVRNCPVKAIRLENDRAEVIPELCIACAHCVKACPAGAKRIREDLDRARSLLAGDKPVLASLAPSFVSEFPGLPATKVINALKKLGFQGVSETALGAQQVSAGVVRLLRQEQKPRIFISSACPTVVELLTKYFPDQARMMTETVSPVLAHCRLLRKHYGNRIGIVFISPCAAKKKEADRHPGLLDTAITFADLRTWWQEQDIDPHGCTASEDDKFIPKPAENGTVYPVDGGMIKSMALHQEMEKISSMTFSGITAIEQALYNIDKLPLDRHLFLELLACEGGCINGPTCQQEQAGTIFRRQAVFGYSKPEPKPDPELKIDLTENLILNPVPAAAFSSAEISTAMREIGKYTVNDELNCGACGYDNCRAFAQALLEKKAESRMCLSYMRKLAQTKANALLKTMPSAVVIVDQNLRIVESNHPFAGLLGEDALNIYQAKPGMEGAMLSKMAEFHPLFSRVLESGEDIVDKDLRFRNHVLRITIFSIEPHRLVGGILQDITRPAIQRGEVIRRTREVINKNLKTVQEIACLLGENAAESEVILDSIIASFTPENTNTDFN